jgi:hypothetical protein
MNGLCFAKAMLKMAVFVISNESICTAHCHLLSVIGFLCGFECIFLFIGQIYDYCHKHTLTLMELAITKHIGCCNSTEPATVFAAWIGARVCLAAIITSINDYCVTSLC